MNYLQYTGIAVIGLGIALFFYLSTRKKYRDPSAAPNYEKIREKLTVREEEEEDTEIEIEEGGFHFSIANLIGSFVVILIGVSLVGPISSQVNSALNSTTIDSSISGNLTSSSGDFAVTTLKLVPAFFIISFIGVGIIVIWNEIRGLGLA